MANVVHNLKVNGSTYPVGTVHYIAGTGTTAGTWLGTDNSITEYYDGLTIAYKIPIAGSSTTTLNINNLGAKTVRRNTSNLTTHLPANTVVILTYTTISGTGYWVWADYDSTRALTSAEPLMDGAAAVGTSSYAARGDHVHPTDTSRAPTSHASSATTYGVSSASNYGHAMASSTTPKANGTAAVGSETAKFARGDHVHPLQTTVSGNAGTATKLATARSIALGTGATGTATNFDGSANITIPVTAVKEAYLSWGGKNFSGSYGCIDAAMVPELGANRLAFMPSAGVVIEYSRNGGSTWIDYGASTDTKINLFNGIGAGIRIGADSTKGIDKSSYMVRVTINTSAAQVYTVLNKFIIYCSTEGSTGSYCTIQARLQSDYESETETWATLADKVGISGWSDYNVINISPATTYGNSKNNQYGQIRFTFGVTSHASSVAYAGLNIVKIYGFGGAGWATPSTMAKTGRMYTYDSGKNVTFPAKVTATGFSGPLTGNATTASGIKDSANSSSTITASYASAQLAYSDITHLACWNGYQLRAVNKSVFAASDHTHTPSEIGAATSTHTHSVATTSAAGLMSKDDKSKLDNIASGANNYSHPSYTAITGKPTANATPGFGGTFTVSQITSDATGHVIGATDKTVTIPNATATTSAAGLMSASDKTKLDGITASADTVTFSASATSGNKVGTITINDNAIDMYSPTQTTVSGNAGSATKLATARTIDGMSFNGTANIAHYGTCSTDAATAEKVVSLTGFTLSTGARIVVKFTVTNTASSPTLNVNSTGAKAIYYRGAAITAGYLAKNRTYEFVYNGTQWDLVGDIDTNTHYTTYLYVGKSGSTGNSTTSNGSTYFKLFEQGTSRSQFSITGSGATTVSSDSNGNITINSTNTTTTTGTTSKTETKMYLVGATGQAASTVTYSNANCYIGTDNCLYSGGTKVATTADLEWGTF